MGPLLLAWRLVWGDVKRRWLQSALLVLMIATTTTVLTLGLALHGISNNPFAATRAATKGPDVVAMYGVRGFAHAPGAFPGSLTRFDAFRRAAGVVASSGPYPIAFPQMSARGLRVQVITEGRDSASATVDQPLLTTGTWARPGGAVLERAFADTLGVTVGQSIRLNGRRYRVVGIALTTDDSFYPQGEGKVWLTRADLQHLEADRPAGFLLNLKLANPAAAPAFAAGHAAPLASRRAWQAWSLYSWQDISGGDLKLIQLEQAILFTVSVLLGLFAVATLAVLVGGRMAEQTRRVGLLKAVGATPRLIAAILLTENLLLSLAAAIIGLTVGRLLAPSLTHAGSGLLGNPTASPLTITGVVLVVLVAAGVACAATIAPATRGARTSTLSALNDSANQPRRHPSLIALSARLPVPLLFGLRLLARRTRRAALATASLTIAAATIVAAITVQHHTNQLNASANGSHHTGMLPGSFLGDRASHLVFLLTAILIVLAVLNTLVTTWTTVIDSQRATALARALGATPGQLAAGLATAQLLPALVAACLGIPLGLALSYISNHGGNLQPPILWLLATIPGSLIVVAALTAIPVRIGARRPVAAVLRSE